MLKDAGTVSERNKTNNLCIHNNGRVAHVVIVACNYPLSAYINCNSFFLVA